MVIKLGNSEIEKIRELARKIGREGLAITAKEIENGMRWSRTKVDARKSLLRNAGINIVNASRTTVGVSDKDIGRIKELAKRIGREDLGITPREITDEMSWSYYIFRRKRPYILAAGINITTAERMRLVEIGKDIGRVKRLAKEVGRGDLSLTPIEVKVEMGWTPTFWRSRKPFILAAGVIIVSENELARRRKIRKAREEREILEAYGLIPKRSRE